MSKSETRRRGPGRPPLLELTLTAPKTTPFTLEQRAQFVALLTDMIVNYRQEQHLERARAAAWRRTLTYQRNLQVTALNYDPGVRMP